jgi:hypothetical protein
MKYPKKGKPKASDEKVISGYQIQAAWHQNEAAINQIAQKRTLYLSHQRPRHAGLF